MFLDNIFIWANLSEVEIKTRLPPFSNYVKLIKEKESPYYDLIKYVLLEFQDVHERYGDGTIYYINPRILEEKIRHEKLTSRNICRTLLAWFYSAELKEGKDFFVTTTSKGRKNYHVVLTSRTLNALSSFI